MDSVLDIPLGASASFLADPRRISIIGKTTALMPGFFLFLSPASAQVQSVFECACVKFGEFPGSCSVARPALRACLRVTDEPSPGVFSRGTFDPWLLFPPPAFGNIHSTADPTDGGGHRNTARFVRLALVLRILGARSRNPELRGVGGKCFGGLCFPVASLVWGCWEL